MASENVLFIMGPTASGKTALAMALAQQHPCRVISVDSALIYKGMDIGTAKPNAAELAATPHHLIDIRAPHEHYSAAHFVHDACQQIKIAHEEKSLAILVGGTMLYHKALLDGLSELPSASEDNRVQLLERIEQHGVAHLHHQLQQVDPESALKIKPNDSQRLIRALDVYQQTGQKLSTLQQQSSPPPAKDWNYKIVQLFPEPREDLHQQIERRFREMVADGFQAEVAKLLASPDISAETPALRAVGYRQMVQHLEGLIDHEQMVAQGIIATRQFAKRQYTWLRSLPYDWRCNPYETIAFAQQTTEILHWAKQQRC